MSIERLLGHIVSIVRDTQTNTQTDLKLSFKKDCKLAPLTSLTILSIIKEFDYLLTLGIDGQLLGISSSASLQIVEIPCVPLFPLSKPN
uniref:Uncharacterized protein n=1 Tax=Caenorhabditis japonica TaxID=281687 RepID=A0A8R1IQQ7_CAEJA